MTTGNPVHKERRDVVKKSTQKLAVIARQRKKTANIAWVEPESKERDLFVNLFK